MAASRSAKGNRHGYAMKTRTSSGARKAFGQIGKRSRIAY